VRAGEKNSNHNNKKIWSQFRENGRGGRKPEILEKGKDIEYYKLQEGS